jgi:hypothetical protein
MQYEVNRDGFKPVSVKLTFETYSELLDFYKAYGKCHGSENYACFKIIQKLIDERDQ